MEKKRNSGLDAREKFFKSITDTSPFRTIHPISHRPQDSLPAKSSPSISITTAKIHPATQHPKTHKNRETMEIVPIKFENSSLPHEKAKHGPVNGQLANVAPKDGPMFQIAPKNMGKTKPKAKGTEQEKNVSRKGEIEPQLHMLSSQQKFKPRADKTSPPQVAGRGRQGAWTDDKVEPPLVSRMESNKLGENMEDAFTDYINRAKIKIRTTSSVDGTSVGDGGKSSASGRDAGEDEFSDYINRAKMKILRTMTSFIGGGSDSMK